MSDLHYICVEESIETAHEKCKSGVISTQFFKRLESILRDLKNADVEPVVRGKWVEMRDPYGDLTGWIHEECGRETNAATEYCSKCGAKMTFVERSGSGE